jgi:plastocyanin
MSTTVNATPSIAFNPSPANVAIGGTVTFAFGTVGHNVFFDAAPGVPADIPGTNSDTSATRTFSTPGTYTYNCHIHPGMRGTIVVASSTTASDGGYGGN